jgi:hypothetical protein
VGSFLPSLLGEGPGVGFFAVKKKNFRSGSIFNVTIYVIYRLTTIHHIQITAFWKKYYL